MAPEPSSAGIRDLHIHPPLMNTVSLFRLSLHGKFDSLPSVFASKRKNADSLEASRNNWLRAAAAVCSFRARHLSAQLSPRTNERHCMTVISQSGASYQNWGPEAFYIAAVERMRSM